MGSKEEAMQQPQQFGVGDRVRTVRKTDGLPKGSYGTVVRVSVAPDCSDVHFDSYPWRRMVYNHDLELVERENAVGQS
jgi:Xrn1-like protein